MARFVQKRRHFAPLRWLLFACRTDPCSALPDRSDGVTGISFRSGAGLTAWGTRGKGTRPMRKTRASTEATTIREVTKPDEQWRQELDPEQ